ncbi:helix-hairpin-helix domain-containing protein [Glaciibacter flavus]|uniref:helix-hairpin-helix domain-containing protein n=1 Tax=Orlajensenia flava TaxID=2565934 RepID=UPI003AFFF8FD
MDAESEGLSGLEPAARSRPRVRLLVGGVTALVLAALVAAVAMALLGAGGSSAVVRASELPTDLRSTDAAAGGSPAGSADTVILVHVLGAVAHPGLYRLSGDARVMDAIAAAGGLDPAADPGGVNLARVLSDGEQLVVPAVGEVPPPAVDGPAGATGGGPGGLVDLNTATVADLDTLPRIGPALAQRILDWRVAHGRFSSVDDLRQVSGIGDKTFDGLRELVRV